MDFARTQEAWNRYSRLLFLRKSGQVLTLERHCHEILEHDCAGARAGTPESMELCFRALVELGCIDFARGRYPSALAWFRRAKEMAPCAAPPATPARLPASVVHQLDRSDDIALIDRLIAQTETQAQASASPDALPAATTPAASASFGSPLPLFNARLALLMSGNLVEEGVSLVAGRHVSFPASAFPTEFLVSCAKGRIDGFLLIQRQEQTGQPSAKDAAMTVVNTCFLVVALCIRASGGHSHPSLFAWLEAFADTVSSWAPERLVFYNLLCLYSLVLPRSPLSPPPGADSAIDLKKASFYLQALNASSSLAGASPSPLQPHARMIAADSFLRLHKDNLPFALAALQAPPVELSSDVGVLQFSGALMFLQKDFLGAAKTFQSVASRNPGVLERPGFPIYRDLINLGICCVARKDADIAIASFRNAAKHPSLRGSDAASSSASFSCSSWDDLRNGSPQRFALCLPAVAVPSSLAWRLLRHPFHLLLAAADIAFSAGNSKKDFSRAAGLYEEAFQQVESAIFPTRVSAIAGHGATQTEDAVALVCAAGTRFAHCLNAIGSPEKADVVCDWLLPICPPSPPRWRFLRTMLLIEKANAVFSMKDFDLAEKIVLMAWEMLKQQAPDGRVAVMQALVSAQQETSQASSDGAHLHSNVLCLLQNKMGVLAVLKGDWDDSLRHFDWCLQHLSPGQDEHAMTCQYNRCLALLQMGGHQEQASREWCSFRGYASDLDTGDPRYVRGLQEQLQMRLKSERGRSEKNMAFAGVPLYFQAALDWDMVALRVGDTGRLAKATAAAAKPPRASAVATSVPPRPVVASAGATVATVSASVQRLDQLRNVISELEHMEDFFG